jgi:hypothetical protein
MGRLRIRLTSRDTHSERQRGSRLTGVGSTVSWIGGHGRHADLDEHQRKARPGEIFVNANYNTFSIPNLNSD